MDLISQKYAALHNRVYHRNSYYCKQISITN